METKTRTKVSHRQKEMMVTFFENNLELNKGVLTNSFTLKTKQGLWLDLTLHLNSEGSCMKSTDKWIKCWSDFKQEVKKRYAQRVQYQNGTGGGPPQKDLTELDQRVLALIGPDAYSGNAVKETAPPSIPIASTSCEPLLEDEQTEQDASVLNASFFSECSQVAPLASSTQIPPGTSTPEQVVRGIRRGLKRKRQRGMVIPPEKTESLIEAQKNTCLALNDIASHLSVANENARRANEIAEERNAISLRKAIAFENMCAILSNAFSK